MKNYLHLKSSLVASIVFATVVVQAGLVRAQDTQVTRTNINRSVFVIPNDPTEGRDPFFPNTRRSLNGENVVFKPSAGTSAAPVSSLVLNGLSGATGHRLAMINGRTLAQGESSDVPAAGGFVKVLCVEIKDKTVIVEVGGARQELFMRGEK